MGTAFIAIDKCDQENGCLKVCLRTVKYMLSFSLLFPQMMCLQVLKGSHHLGRIVHKTVGEQVGADMERVELVKQVCLRSTSSISQSPRLRL